MQNQTANTLKSKALAALDAGQLQQALKKAQLGVKKFPKDSDFHAISGFVLTEMKQYKRSIPHFVEASRMKPDDPQFVENLANALMQTGQIPKALDYTEHKLAKFPNNKELNRVLDEIHLKGSNWRLVIDYVSKKLKDSPDDIRLLSKRAQAYSKIGFVEDNLRDVERAYALAPDDLTAAFHKSVSLHQSGDRKGSRKILERILKNEPDNPSALLEMSNIIVKEDAADLLNLIDAAILASPDERNELEFAKAHAISKIDSLEAAMPQFQRANAIQHDSNPYVISEEEEKFAQITSCFPLGNKAPVSDLNETPAPIFVLGQPRSGTTLMEMMLSSAPDVAGCGELMLGAELSAEFVEGKQDFSAKKATDFARQYRMLMPPVPDTSTAFVDKIPHNYQYVGFILSAFPNAKVVNMMRDPRDVGLSKWIRRFPAGGMRYASNLQAIAHSANMYRRYMAHWQALFGDRILTIPYEKLVSEAKTCSQQVAAFCGVEWTEAMIHPEKNTSQVRTASIDQVRSKISTKSIGGWQSVAEHLQPMLDGFDPALWPEYDLG